MSSSPICACTQARIVAVSDLSIASICCSVFFCLPFLCFSSLSFNDAHIVPQIFCTVRHAQALFVSQHFFMSSTVHTQTCTFHTQRSTCTSLVVTSPRMCCVAVLCCRVCFVPCIRPPLCLIPSCQTICFIYFSVIQDAGDVAPYRQSDTSPVLERLWLEKMTHTAEEDVKPLLPAMTTLI